MSDFFAWPVEWLWLFALILPLPWLIRWLPPAPRGTSFALKVPFYHNLLLLVNHQKSVHKPNTRIPLLAWLIWLLLVFAAMRPQWIGEPIQISISGRDLLLAVDISKSMEESDLALYGTQAQCTLESSAKVDRLSVVKAVLGEFIERRKGDRLGLILFGSKAYLQTPLTFDRQTVKTMLKEAEIGLAGDKTALSDAIGLAVKQLRQRPQSNRVLILLTDGNNSTGEFEPLQIIDLAIKHAVRIYTIGVGAEKVCLCDEFSCGWHKDNSVALDETTLQEIAKLTGGQYFRAQNRTRLEYIYAELDKYEPVTEEMKTFRPKIPLYPWFLGIAFFMSLIFMVINKYNQLRTN